MYYEHTLCYNVRRLFKLSTGTGVLGWVGKTAAEA